VQSISNWQSFQCVWYPQFTYVSYVYIMAQACTYYPLSITCYMSMQYMHLLSNGNVQNFAILMHYSMYNNFLSSCNFCTYREKEVTQKKQQNKLDTFFPFMRPCLQSTVRNEDVMQNIILMVKSMRQWALEKCKINRMISFTSPIYVIFTYWVHTVAIVCFIPRIIMCEAYFIHRNVQST